MYDIGTEECLIYAPPKSVAFGHQARIRDARCAWAQTLVFLDEFAHHRVSPHIQLQCWGSNLGVDPTVAEARTHAAIDIFGPPEGFEWAIPTSRLDEAIAFALDDDHWPRQVIGPTWLSFSIQFLWKAFLPAPPTTDPEAFHLHEYASRFGVILGNHRLFIQPGLLIPRPYDSAHTKRFLSRLDHDLPFRLRPQYFQRLLPSPRGGYKRTLRLPKGWLSGA
jgi:hypothetical protein